jgi:putative endonuclease
MASKKNGTIYVGVTDNLIKRVCEHKHDLADGFSKKYQTHSLVYYETGDNPMSAISREKQLKRWKRNWKLRLIETNNPFWQDLYSEITR